MKKYLLILSMALGLNVIAQNCPTFQFDVSPDTICPSGSVTLSANITNTGAYTAPNYTWTNSSGGILNNYSYAPVIYNLYPTYTGTSDTVFIYTVAMSAPGCPPYTSHTFSVPLIQIVPVTFTLLEDTLSLPHSVNIYPIYPSGTPADSVFWTWGDTSSYDNALYPTHTYDTAGTYDICVYVQNGSCGSSYCLNSSIYRSMQNSSTDNNIIRVNVVNSTTNIKQVLSNNLVTVYPNPNKGSFNIDVTDFEYASVEIYNALGEKVAMQKLQSKITSLNIEELASGIYSIRIIKNNSMIYANKIVKQ